jgi:ABC-type lipoprotein release transport system permease subunit
MRERSPPPLVWLLDPRSLDPGALLQAIQQRIERIDVERELPTGPGMNQLALVTAAIACYLPARRAAKLDPRWRCALNS